LLPRCFGLASGAGQQRATQERPATGVYLAQRKLPSISDVVADIGVLCVLMYMFLCQ
jgi:hypothetical protein